MAAEAADQVELIGKCEAIEKLKQTIVRNRPEFASQMMQLSGDLSIDDQPYE